MSKFTQCLVLLGGPYADFERIVTNFTLVLWIEEGASLARKEAIYVPSKCLGGHRISSDDKPRLGLW